MSIYLLTPEPWKADDQIKAIEAKLLTMVPELRKIERIQDISAEIGSKSDGKITVIFVSPTLPRSSIDNFINIARRYRDRAFFILISNEISGDDYKRLIRSGGADWVAANGSLQEIAELTHKQKLSYHSAQAKEAYVKPTVISFLPCMGGVGNTTVALEVALRIKLAKATRFWKVCYIDLDFQTSHVCDYLDTEARFQIHDILDRPERLDQQLFELFVTHHACGLDIFAAPRSKLDPCQIDETVLDPFLEMILEKYDFIVLDLPVPWFSWTGPTLENSDAIIMTGINTIPCLRQAKATLDAVVNRKVSPSQIAIVMNRITHRLFGGMERRKHVESVFPNEQIFYIGEHRDAVDRVNTGTPAALGADHAKDFARLAAFCTNLRQTPRGEKLPYEQPKNRVRLLGGSEVSLKDRRVEQ
jgi:pilus assembly protein CpaE